MCDSRSNTFTFFCRVLGEEADGLDQDLEWLEVDKLAQERAANAER